MTESCRGLQDGVTDVNLTRRGSIGRLIKKGVKGYVYDSKVLPEGTVRVVRGWGKRRH